MIIIKKLLSLLLVLVFSFVLVGCGSSAPKYTITKDVKIKDEIFEEEQKTLLDELRKNLNDTKKATLEYDYNIDSGEFEKDGIKKSYTLTIRYDIIIDESGDKLQFAFGYNGKAKVKENGKTKERYMFNGTEFVKDDVIYYNTYYQLLKKKDGNEIADVREAKYKEPFTGKIDKFLGDMVDIPTKISDISKSLFVQLTPMLISKGKEIGKMNKKTFIIQNVLKDNDTRKPIARVVSEKGLLTYIGLKMDNELVKDITIDKQFSLGNAKINYPNFDSYKEKDAK